MIKKENNSRAKPHKNPNKIYNIYERKNNLDIWKRAIANNNKDFMDDS